MRKADTAAALLRAISAASLPGLKEEYSRRLDALWPGIRCSYSEQRGLQVFFRSDHASLEHLPRTLLGAADYIEEVLLDGRGRVHKNLRGPEGPIPLATMRISELEGVLPRRNPSVWTHLLEDED